MRAIGYSTGAIFLGDFRRALALLGNQSFNAVELSALRMAEVLPLIEALPSLDLSSYKYVAFHAPSKFGADEEDLLVDLLSRLPVSWPIILHPDAMSNVAPWRTLGSRVAIENMDKRKPTGRTRRELENIFRNLPEARMCFDIGHARQVDTSMTEAFLMLKAFGDRIVQLHVSEVDALNRHSSISYAAEIAFRQVAPYVPVKAALIIESRIAEEDVYCEGMRTLDIFSPQIVQPDLFWSNINISGWAVHLK